MIVINDFLKNAEEVRELALASTFIDWTGYDGEVYKRICIADIPGLKERLEEVMGPVNILGMGFRLNYEKELPNAAIHTDVGWGTHALVLYLSDGPSGTAFWKHNATSEIRLKPNDLTIFNKVKHDWDSGDKWTMDGYSHMRFNRALIYESELFHSRYPFEGFGTTPEDGRLIAVAFFTPTGEENETV